MEEKISELKDNDKMLLNKVIEHDSKLARIEEHQGHTDELIKDNQRTLNAGLKTLNDNIGASIREAVDGRVHNLAVTVDGQQKTLNKIIEVQGKQTQQIGEIQKTLNHFTKIEERVNDHEERIKSLEDARRTEDEIRKERVKGRWALGGAIVAAIGAIITAIITSVL